MENVVNGKKANRKARRANLQKGMLGEEDLPPSVMGQSELSDLILSCRTTDNIDWEKVSKMTYSEQMTYLKGCIAKRSEQVDEAMNQIENPGVKTQIEQQLEKVKTALHAEEASPSETSSEEEITLDITSDNGYKLSEENNSSSNIETSEKKEIVMTGDVNTNTDSTTTAKEALRAASLPVPGVWEAIKASKVTYVLVGVALTLVTAMAAAKLAGKEDEVSPMGADAS